MANPLWQTDPYDPGYADALRASTTLPMKNAVDPTRAEHFPVTYPGGVHIRNLGDTGPGIGVGGYANTTDQPVQFEYEEYPGSFSEAELEGDMVGLFGEYTPNIAVHELLHGNVDQYTDPAGAPAKQQTDHPFIYASEAYNARTEQEFKDAVAASVYGTATDRPNAKMIDANLKELGVDGETYLREWLRQRPEPFAATEYDMASEMGNAPNMSREDYIKQREGESYIAQKIKYLRDNDIYE